MNAVAVYQVSFDDTDRGVVCAVYRSVGDGKAAMVTRVTERNEAEALKTARKNVRFVRKELARSL